MATVPSRIEQCRQIARDLLSGKPDADHSDLYFIDADQALDWYRAKPMHGKQDPHEALSEAIVESDKGARKALDRLAFALLGDISADELLELRDVLRSSLIDVARREIVYQLQHGHYLEDERSEEVLTNAQIAREHGVFAHGDPLTGKLHA